VGILAGCGASEYAILNVLQRQGVACNSRHALCRAFKEELRHGRETMVAALSMRLYHLATTDGPHSFQALAFLLRSRGGPAWRVPKGEDGDPRVPADEDNSVVIYLPSNGRDPPPDAGTEIEGEAEPVTERRAASRPGRGTVARLSLDPPGQAGRKSGPA
jgi:hypothetical protein